jgi:hypothetical protein
MDLAPKKYSARQLLGLLERDVVLRGRLPRFSELAYRSDGPSVDVYLDVLGEGDWNSLQSGLSAWLGARGYQIDREGTLVAKLPPPPKPVAPPPGAPQPKDAPGHPKKKAPHPLRRRSMIAIGEVVEQDWGKLKPEQLSEECRRSLSKRFPPHAAQGQNAVGNKIVNALLGMLQGAPIGFGDGRQLVRTLLALLFPEASQNQLTISPLFWREDPLGGLIAQANLHLYGDDGLYAVAEAVDRLGITFSEFAERLAQNEFTLVFTRAYALSRHEIDPLVQARHAQ